MDIDCYRNTYENWKFNRKDIAIGIDFNPKEMGVGLSNHSTSKRIRLYLELKDKDVKGLINALQEALDSPKKKSRLDDGEECLALDFTE